MPETIVPQMIEEDKKTDQGKVVRILFAIPNEGHTQVEAYADRIVGAMHMGKVESIGRTAAAIESLIREEDPVFADKIMEKFWTIRPQYKDIAKDKRFEFYFVTMGRIFTPYAREEAAQLAIDHHMDYIFMVDDDMTCPEDLFERLYRWDKDIVAPLAFTRNFPHHPVLYATVNGWDPIQRIPFFKNQFVNKYPKDKLVECDAVGFGAVLIKTSVLKAMPTPRFMSTCGTGEDVYFCLKAKEKGFRVFMDTSTKLGHLSHPQIITEEFVEKMRERMDMQIEKKNGNYTKYETQEDFPKLILGTR